MNSVDKNLTPFKWLLLILSVAVVTVGCGSAAEGPQARSAADEPEPEPQIVIPEDPHLLLPASCFGALSIDLKALRSSSVFQNYTKKIATDLNQMEKRVADYIVEQTDRLVVGLVLRSKKSKKKPYSVVIGRGDFDVKKLLDIIKELSATDQAKGLNPVTKSKPQEGRFSVFLDDGEIQGLILDNRTIMVADIKLIPDVLDLLTDRDIPRFVNSKLYKRINPHVALGQGGLSMIASAPNPVKKKIIGRKKAGSIFAKYESALQSIQAGGVRVDLNSDVNIEVVAETASRDHPQTIVNMINGLLFIGRIAIDDPVFSALADQLSTRVNGLFVHVKLRATEQQVSHMIEIAEERAK
jgi:hypothetical protein